MLAQGTASRSAEGLRAVLFYICIFSNSLIGTPVQAQLDADIAQTLSIARSGAPARAAQQWQNLRAVDLICLVAELRKAKVDLNDLIERGVAPNGAELQQVRHACALHQPLTVAADPLPSPYGLAGMTLGQQFDVRMPEHSAYQCRPSEQFLGSVWCQRRHRENRPGGSVALATSILHSTDGSISYLSQTVEPSVLRIAQITAEIDRLSRRFRSEARVFTAPIVPRAPRGVIATWGDVQLLQIPQSAAIAIAQGQPVAQGLLIDFLGNFQASARLGLPIYRIGARAGYIWSASYDAAGRGHIRFVAADPSNFAAPPASASLPTLDSQSPQIRMNGRLAEGSGPKVLLLLDDSPILVGFVSDTDSTTARMHLKRLDRPQAEEACFAMWPTEQPRLDECLKRAPTVLNAEFYVYMNCVDKNYDISSLMGNAIERRRLLELFDRRLAGDLLCPGDQPARNIAAEDFSYIVAFNDVCQLGYNSRTLETIVRGIEGLSPAWFQRRVAQRHQEIPILTRNRELGRKCQEIRGYVERHVERFDLEPN